MTDHTALTASELDLTGAIWRKSTFSGHNSNCVEVAAVPWRKSTFSGPNGECVEVAAAAWRKSSLSGHNSECVEVAPTHNIVAVRDSKDRSGPVLTFGAAEWEAFLSGIRAGEFD